MSELPEFRKDPRRRPFIAAVSRVLSEGIVLDTKDIIEGAVAYGYGPHSNLRFSIMRAWSTRVIMKEMHDVQLLEKKFKKRVIFLDSSSEYEEGLRTAQQQIIARTALSQHN